ncbi:SET domain-containing protein [Apiospora arundinis]
MTAHSELLKWAKAEGFQLNGIRPTSTSGCGTGIIASRKLKEPVLIVPIRAIRSVKTITPELFQQTPPAMPLHGLLAAELALDNTNTLAAWRHALPTMADITVTMPHMWREELQNLLPPPARNLLEKQQAKYRREWKMISQAIPSVREEEFRYYWFIINTRTFLHDVPETQHYNWEDRLALVPVADMFNHAESGCNVSYTPEHYTVTTDRAYEVGEEVFISYGDHSNDFLLAEYGFLMVNNCWDMISIDDIVIPRLDEAGKEELGRRDLLGKYMIHAEKGPCRRTLVALRMLCCPHEQWLQYVEGRDDGHGSQHAVNVLLCEVLGDLQRTIEENLSMVDQLSVGTPNSDRIFL